MTKDILTRATSKPVSVAFKILIGFAIILGLPVAFFLGFAIDFMSYGKSSGTGLRSIAIFTLMVPATYIFIVGALLISSRKRKQKKYKDQVRSDVLNEIGNQPTTVQAKILTAVQQSPGSTLEEILVTTSVSKEDALPAITELLGQRQIVQRFVDGKTIIEPRKQV